MKIISVDVDEEFAKALEAIEQPYLDRSILIKKTSFLWVKAVQNRTCNKKVFRRRSKHVEGC